MFEELNQHRAAVAEQIQKAMEIGFTGNELEKAHKVGDIHPNGKWVWTQLPSGKYDWRVIKKTGGSAGGSAPQAAQKQSISISANHPSLSGLKGVSNMKDYLTTFNSKYTDMSKVEVVRTPKGNWDVHYDGHRLGIFAGDQVPESTAKKMGWLKTDSKDLTRSKHRGDDNKSEGKKEADKISKEEYLKKASKALGAYNGSSHYTSGQTPYGKMDIYVNTYFGKKEYSVHFITADGVDVSRQVDNAMIGNSGTAAKKAVLKYLEENYKKD